MKTCFWSERESLIRDFLLSGTIKRPDEVSFGFLENERYFNRLSPLDFLHGYCNVFAEYLHNTYGFLVENIWHGSDLIHSYCVIAESGKKPVYIDIRGKIDDFEEFIEEFELTESDLDPEGDFRITNGVVETDDGEMCYKFEQLYEAAKRFDDYYRIAA